MPDTEHYGDVAAALAAAEDHVQIVEALDEHEALVVGHRTDRQVEQVDLERYLPAPVRARGTIATLTADGFVTAYKQRTTDATPAAIYADLDKTRLVAVLNDDTTAGPGWRDHRVTYQPQPTPAWIHWVSNQGLGTQERFALVIEEGETDIINPSATVMLDVAQTFQASVGARFKQQGRLKDGRVQLVYEEEIDATVGEGDVKVPDSFTVQVRPFYGAEPVDVECRVRYTCRGGKLEIGYTINRPEDIVRQSFIDSVVGYVDEQLPDARLVEGLAGDAVRPGR